MESVEVGRNVGRLVIDLHKSEFRNQRRESPIPNAHLYLLDGEAKISKLIPIGIYAPVNLREYGVDPFD